jgi:hypothetical protein
VRRGTNTQNNTHPPYHRREVQCPHNFLGIQWNMLDWTPHLNEHLLTLNSLWMYCTLDFAIQMHLLWIDTPTLNIERFFNTLLKISMWIASQNRMTSSSRNNAPFALHHGTWQDGTIRITNTSDLPCTCARACACMLWLKNDWKKKIRCKDLRTKGQHIARLVQWHGYESYRVIKKLWHFMSSCKKKKQ